MHKGQYTLYALLACAVLAGLAAACSPQFDIGVDFPPHELSGTYLSDEQVGVLGILLLELERVPGSTRVYKATLAGLNGGELGGSEGIGTLGNEHLILNFNPGSDLDYYLELTVELDGSSISTMSGTFIFPDQKEPLEVTFRPA
ncbi:hypothetical protein IIA79_04420 [bacterium]|nr:hypothetical protein [bacterium]